MGVELAIMLGKGWILLGIQPFVVCARGVCQRLRQPENGLGWNVGYLLGWEGGGVKW